MSNLNRIIFSGKICSEVKYSTITGRNGKTYEECNFNLLMITGVSANNEAKTVIIACKCNSEVTQIIRQEQQSGRLANEFLNGTGTFMIDDAISGINVDMAVFGQQPFNHSKVILVGRLSKDPQSKNGNSGTITEFTPVIDAGYGDDKNVAFPIVTAWNSTAKYVRDYLKKSQLVAVDCQIEGDKYRSDKDGKNRYKFTAFSVKALSYNKEQSNNDNSNQRQQNSVQNRNVNSQPQSINVSELIRLNSQPNGSQQDTNVQQPQNFANNMQQSQIMMQQPVNLQPNNGMMQQQMGNYQPNNFVNPVQQAQPVQNFQQQNAMQMGNNQNQINQMQYGNINPQLNLVQDSDLEF